MIARLSGMLLEKQSDAVVIDVGGVGYLVHLSQQSMLKVGPPGAAIELRTHTHVREDALQLFGFATEDEEELFHLLISVSGVGPRLGLNILSGMPAPELAAALVGGEIARLTKISGVGKKTAERLIVELKDKLKTSQLLTRAGRSVLPGVVAGADRALVSALLNLGYKPAAAQRTAEVVRRTMGAKAGLEDQLREALKVISGGQ